MNVPTITRQWRFRLMSAVVLGAIGFVAAAALDLDPQPAAYVVMVTIVSTIAWLVLDTIDASAARWLPGLRPAGDRVDEAPSDLRILTSHQQASAPSEALRDRLVALARARDPDLATSLHSELAAVRRLSPTDIDRILTRIEETRDRT